MAVDLSVFANMEDLDLGDEELGEEGDDAAAAGAGGEEEEES